jgi:hypothetical protein
VNQHPEFSCLRLNRSSRAWDSESRQDEFHSKHGIAVLWSQSMHLSSFL